MKRWLVAVCGIAMAGVAYAGEWSVNSDDPHHSAQGGCESKAKIAKLKEMYGDDWAKMVKKHHLEEKAKAEQSKKEPAKDQFI